MSITFRNIYSKIFNKPKKIKFQNYYEDIKTRYTHWNIFNFILLNNCDHIFKTYKHILFRKIPYGINRNQFKQYINKPYLFKFVNNDINTIDSIHIILFYKLMIADLKTICEIHFLNNQFFMAKYYFGENSIYNSENILKTFKTKYGVKDENLKNFQIVDSLNNKIIIKDDVELSITYLSNNASIHQLIEYNIDIENNMIKDNFENKSKIIFDSL